ncbi:selenocysteine-specific translation elongation factor [Alkalicoccus urumqiensis]|uniref:selenocysteine-specific translation elongation factor n=1 Tax=Alkalicoccus urumqiensis TaxID=1548213 RepID=UPI001FE1F641|nr:selenocysteine-specific translation elongation factor [Alkalicoccus urumqiensis]
MNYFTIGMAGHIDHGKTTLTKALTNQDTDRLKEEKERNISIEPGFARLETDDSIEVSIIDVPGHERFIRQMIAGVSGIDMVILVIAADEGVMPQTKEHVHILELLGTEVGMIAFTKSDGLDEEMQELLTVDVQDQLEGTFAQEAPVYFVDSLTKTGIDELKEAAVNKLKAMPARRSAGPFRLPVDQSFSVKGQGTVVRGTVQNGTASVGDVLHLLPHKKEVRIRQMQVHHEKRETVHSGQRAAINLGGIDYSDIHRGDVLVSGDFPITKTIDTVLFPVPLFKTPLKQRAPVKLHTGTSEVYGKIVFFDRNELTHDEQGPVFCQVRLDEAVVCDRNDRFILRRPTPMETIGGGAVIDPSAETHRFGKQTVEELERRYEGTPEERLQDFVQERHFVLVKEASQALSLPLADVEAAAENLPRAGEFLTTKNSLDEAEELALMLIRRYQKMNPLRRGKPFAELLQELPYEKEASEALAGMMIEREAVRRRGAWIHESGWEPHFPKEWRKRMEQVEADILESGLEPPVFEESTANAGLPEEWSRELRMWMLAAEALELDEKHLISRTAFEEGMSRLQEHTADGFSLQEAKEHLGLTRKYLVPLLELADKEGWTARKDKDRIWR